MVQSSKIEYNKDRCKLPRKEKKMQNTEWLNRQIHCRKGSKDYNGFQMKHQSMLQNQQKKDDLKYVSPETYRVTISL